MLGKVRLETRSLLTQAQVSPFEVGETKMNLRCDHPVSNGVVEPGDLLQGLGLARELLGQVCRSQDLGRDGEAEDGQHPNLTAEPD